MEPLVSQEESQAELSGSIVTRLRDPPEVIAKLIRMSVAKAGRETANASNTVFAHQFLDARDWKHVPGLRCTSCRRLIKGIPIPVAYSEDQTTGKFQTKHTMCSDNCRVRYLLSDNATSFVKEFLNALNERFRRILGKKFPELPKGPFKPAPPVQLLTDGVLTEDEYGQDFSEWDSKLELVDPPFVHRSTLVSRTSTSLKADLDAKKIVRKRVRNQKNEEKQRALMPDSVAVVPTPCVFNQVVEEAKAEGRMPWPRPAEESAPVKKPKLTKSGQPRKERVPKKKKPKADLD